MIFFLIAVISACLSETVYWVWPENIVIRAICKAIFAVCILAAVLFCADHKNPGFKWIFTFLVLACAADVVIVFLFPAGAGLFALAHICLIILFYKKRPLDRKKWIIWGIISAIAVAAILLLGSEMGIYAYGAAVYAPILLLMVVTAAGQKGVIRIAAFLFFVSDLLLALYQWKHIHPVLHVVYMLLFYAALLMFAGEKEMRYN